MTQQEIRKFYEDQIEWYKKEVEWCDKDIAFLTRQLESNRKEDRELVEYVWSRGVMTRLDMEIYGKEKFEGVETHKNLLCRRRQYLNRKKYNKQIEKYEKLLAQA